MNILRRLSTISMLFSAGIATAACGARSDAPVSHPPSVVSTTPKLAASSATNVAARPPSAPASSWMQSHVGVIRDLSFDDTEYADLVPLARSIGDAHVVALGEESHGDGTAFQTKARIARFLHEKMGFEVIAFEGSLQDCAEAWESLTQGKDVLDTIHRCVFRIWSDSAQVRPLVEYIGSSAKTDHPLILAGFDLQFRPPPNPFTLPDGLKRATTDAAGKNPIPPATWARLTTELEHTRDDKHHDAKERDQAVADMALVKQSFDARRAAASRPDDELWSQIIANAAAYVAYRLQPVGADATADMKSRSNARDDQMAKNLVWLLRQRYPGKKIIAWGASLHLLRSIEGIDLSVDPTNGGATYDGLAPMGTRVAKELGNDYYVVGFTAGEGESSMVVMPQDVYKIEPPLAGSIERDLWDHGFQNAVLDFHALDGWGARYAEPMLSRPFGYGWMKARWSNIFDALVFNRTMERSKPVSVAGAPQK